MNRREFSACVATGVIGAPLECFAQVKPFVIRVVRSGGWQQLMQRELCIPGTVYSVDPDRTQSDRPGSFVCYSMELPQRGNQNQISAIPVGSYRAAARVSDNNGPVIQLSGVAGREAIQIHSGNAVDHTLGCILLGNTKVSQAPKQGSEILTAGKCWIAGSKAARKELLALYGWTELDKAPPARRVTVIVE